MNNATEPAVWFPAIRANSGADVFTRALADGLRQRGVRTAITWLPQYAEYAPWLVNVPQPPKWANIAHVNTWLPKRLLPQSLPYIATVHSNVHDPALNAYKSAAKILYHRLIIRRSEKYAILHAAKVVAVSKYVADHATRLSGRHDIAVIYNGIDIDIFCPANSVEPHVPFRLLFVGKWSKLKGVDMLTPIMNSLGGDYVLHYTADDDHSKTLQRKIPAAHSIGRIASREGMADAYRNVDALLFPTRLEGLPLAAIEAQACGLPVVATQGSSLPEVIVDGQTGVLCRQDDPTAFATAVERLATNPNQWRQMRTNARNHAAGIFDIHTMIDRYHGVYDSVLAMAN